MNSLITVLKLFKYLRISDRFSVLIKTLVVAGPELGFFGVILIVIFLAYGLCFYVAFGYDVYKFMTPLSSVGYMFQVLATSFDEREYVIEKQPTYGNLISLSFVGLMTLVLLNVFIAIIIGEKYTCFFNWLLYLCHICLECLFGVPQRAHSFIYC